MERTFQVDLRGVVDLFSHHLYSSPRVYLRELLQNAVDAITARRAVDPGCPAVVAIEPADTDPGGALRISDSGIGLTEPEVHELLATIGRSSKRDDLGFGRRDFLGQFGVGLLSCFLVADEVQVITRSVRGGDTLVWTGYADGRYTVSVAPQQRTEPGTTVALVPRREMEHWLSTGTVTELATRFGGLLPVDLRVAGRRVTWGEPPWKVRHASPDARRRALTAYAEQTFGFAPLDIIDLGVPEADLTGVAFVLPTPASPASRGGQRVYLRRMLLGDDVESLLPEWAFFVRCVVDAGELRPTASREGLYEDDLLARTRRALGDQVKTWLVHLSATSPQRLQQFLRIHHLGVKALAVHDREMVRVVDRWWPMETNVGPLPLAEFRRRYPVVTYTSTAEEFRELAAVAGAQGIGLVNGGYTYDIEIMKRLVELDPAVRVKPLDPADLTTRFETPDPVALARLAPFLRLAEDVLRPMGCAVLLRAFDPAGMAAVYLVGRAAVAAAELREAREAASPLWAGVLDAVGGEPPSTRPQLVLNLRNPAVTRVTTTTDPGLAALGVQALYGQAVLWGHHPLGAEDSALLNQAFVGLLDRALLTDGTP